MKSKKGSNVAVVALARKVLCILHHLLTNQEMYQEGGFNKKVKIGVGKDFLQRKMDLNLLRPASQPWDEHRHLLPIFSILLSKRLKQRRFLMNRTYIKVYSRQHIEGQKA